MISVRVRKRIAIAVPALHFAVVQYNNMAALSSIDYP